MTNTNRNSKLDHLEQDFVIGLYDSYLRLVANDKDKVDKISFLDYMTALKFGLEHPEILVFLQDDRKKWWDNGGKCCDVYDILSERG